jgi:hypothetical protein
MSSRRQLLDHTIYPSESRFTTPEVQTAVQFWVDLHGEQAVAAHVSIYAQQAAMATDEGALVCRHMARLLERLRVGGSAIALWSQYQYGLIFGGGFQIMAGSKPKAEVGSLRAAQVPLKQGIQPRLRPHRR